MRQIGGDVEMPVAAANGADSVVPVQPPVSETLPKPAKQEEPIPTTMPAFERDEFKEAEPVKPPEPPVTVRKVKVTAKDMLYRRE